MNSLPRFCVVLGLVCSPAWAQVSPNINSSPSREFGHTFLTLGSQSIAPNLVEGRELNSPSALAFDTSVTPAILYVADTSNHRILAFRNPGALTSGNKADKVIGQRDFYSTFPGGPGSVAGLISPGMAFPNSLAVDSNGNLYVVDAGNNRILRFHRPMEQQGDFVSPDMVIGQKTPGAGNQSNEGLSKPTEKTLSFNRQGSVSRAAITFDAQGNLWVADSLNNRVLRFPKAKLPDTGASSEPAADLVLGHSSFDNDDTPITNLQSDLQGLARPSALAFDSNGGLYVADAYLRLVYYDTQSTGTAARRILGIQPTPAAGQQRPTAPTEYTIGQVGNLSVIPQCVFTLGTVVFACDNASHRIVRYGSPDTWAAPTNDALSPAQTGVYGQSNFRDSGINRNGGLNSPGNNTFYAPTAGAVFNNELWVADTGNNRVVALRQDGGAFNFTVATRVVGQIGYDLNAPNLVEGRELFLASNDFHGSAIAVDRNSTPNRLYISDSLNHRILGFADVRKVGTDAKSILATQADVIIGQPDQFHAAINYPNNDPLLPSDQGLFTPTGIAVDKDGNLWVADTNNARVLRFPSPFNQPAGAARRANLVLGQQNFTNKITDASTSTMGGPFGVAIFNNGDVAASDLAHNRILLWRKSGADFTNGQGARNVLGQQSFSTTAASSSAAGLNGPRGLAVDGNDRLYVADTNNGRLVVYGNTGFIVNGASGTSIPNLGQAEGVAVSVSTGEIWVASLNNNAVYRFDEFSKLPANASPTAFLSTAAPLGVGLDSFDNVIVAEGANRMTFFYARVVYRHAANYASGSNISATLTPVQFTLIARSGSDFAFTPVSNSPPYPKVTGGYQVTVNGIPAPITSLTATAIYFLVPNDAPSSGDVEVQVTRPATGEIVGAGTFTMGPAAPGFFTSNQQGTGQIAALHADYSVNSQSNPIAVGQIISLFLTGHGHIDGLVDGVAPGRTIETPGDKPVIIIGGLTVNPSNISYSGVSTEYPGLWQINVRIPKIGDPGVTNGLVPGKNFIIVQMREVPSTIIGGPIGTDTKIPANSALIQFLYTKN
ncbi:MAG: hypothetical protein ABI811_04220 [Acidobacteriota bacterium]